MTEKALHPRRDPTRRRMKLPDWPEQDRSAWQKAIDPGDPFAGSGAAAHWRVDTRKKVTAAYGRWMTFLKLQNLLDQATGPGERITEAALRAYVAELKEQVAPVTLSGLITDLEQALHVMVPGRTFPLLATARKNLAAQAKPGRNKVAKVVPARDVLNYGIKVMEEAELGPIRCEKHRAPRYRDGLMIVLLAARPTRRRNFCNLRIGRNLIRTKDGYRLYFDGSETKNGDPIDVPVPGRLTAYIDRYLEVYRPALLRDRDSDRLWVTLLDSDMAEDTIAICIVRETRKAFGHAINMHAFRDCLATDMAINDPEHVLAVAPMLGQRSPETAETYYNQAQCMTAAKPYQDDILALREEMKAARRRGTRKPEGRG